MQQTCRKCGRLKVIRIPAFEEEEKRFKDSIRDLEEAARSLAEELKRLEAEDDSSQETISWPWQRRD
jgi:hypothetical protein